MSEDRERWLEERFDREMDTVTLPPRDRWTPASRPSRPLPLLMQLGAGALVVVLALAVGAALRDLRGDIPQVGAPVLPLPAERVPADWTVHARSGLLFATPPEWGLPGPTLVDRSEDGPEMLVFGWDGAAIDVPRVRVDVWAHRDVDALVEERYVRGSVEEVRRRDLPGEPRMVELIVGGIRWTSPSDHGTYEVRHIFIQVAPHVVADIIVWGPPVASEESRVSGDLAALQDRVARFLRYAPDADATYRIEEVESVLRRAMQEATGRDPGPRRRFESAGLYPHGELYAIGDTAIGDRADVIVYPDPQTRIQSVGRDFDPMAWPVSWVKPAAGRALGNVAVVVLSDDADVRYRVLASLDTLLGPSSP